MLCKICASIVRTALSYVPPKEVRGPGIIIPTTRDEIQKSCQNGCRICGHIIDHLPQRFVQFHLEVRVTGHAHIVRLVYWGKPTGSPPPFADYLCTIPNVYLEPSDGVSALEGAESRVSATTTGELSVLQLGRHWYRHCVEYHSECTKGASTFCPTRLLDLEAGFDEGLP